MQSPNGIGNINIGTKEIKPLEMVENDAEKKVELASQLGKQHANTI